MVNELIQADDQLDSVFDVRLQVINESSSTIMIQRSSGRQNEQQVVLEIVCLL
jgi:hypothetical protein